MNPALEYLLPVITTLAALILGYFSHMYVAHIKAGTARDEAERQLTEARKEAETLLRESRIAIEKEALAAEKEANTLQKEAQHLRTQYLERLNAVADLSPAEAKEHVLEQARENCASELGKVIAEEAATLRSRAEEEARIVLMAAMERVAAPLVESAVITEVKLPGEEMKGRLIGKDGRNIRSFEQETGVNLIVDETPKMVTLSCFDPLRREIARRSLEALLEDGRIHPTNIESTVQEESERMQAQLLADGNAALEEFDLKRPHPEVVEALGRLNYRTSYGQNQLHHAREMARLMSAMATELGLAPNIAARIGLFHDLGKSLDIKQGKTHAQAGAALLEKHGEPPVIVNAVAAHHREVPPESAYASLTITADTITAARPGARIDQTDTYTRRLKEMEELATSMPGIQKAYAIQAGRELRVVVNPEDVDDDGALVLARDLTRKIETDLQFPGRIKVTVLRERRWVEYAG